MRYYASGHRVIMGIEDKEYRTRVSRFTDNRKK